MSKKYGKGSEPRPLSISYSDYSDNWELAFGKKKSFMKKNKLSSENTPKKVNNKPRRLSLCPHCATNNLKKENEFFSKCKKCGWQE